MFKAGHVLDGAFANQIAAEFFPAISANYSVDEAAYLTELLQLADPGEAGIAAIRERARPPIQTRRARDKAGDTLDALLRQYSLDTQEGLMLMCLAEALLRVPDAATADALIRDKLNAAEWERHLGQSDNVLVNFAAWGLVMTGKVVDPETADGRPKNVIGRLLKRSGEPVIRAAMNQAMKLMGKQFVLGRTIAEALKNGRPEREKGYTYSFDMLGEAALTAEDAAKYMAAYRQAGETVGAEPQVGPGPRPSVSIKLSALHPRYEVAQRERVLNELFASVRELAILARRLDVGITIDAEEADRLELSLELFEKLMRDPAIAGWGEFGLVIQAYSKRCLPVLVWLTLLGRELGARIPPGAGRLPGLYPEGRHRYVLPRLRPLPALRAHPRRDLPTVRQPQRAYRQLHPGHGRAGGAAARIRVSAPARHGRCAVRHGDREVPQERAHLCAGRRPQGPAALSGAPPAGERCQLVLRPSAGRSARAGRVADRSPG